MTDLERMERYISNLKYKLKKRATEPWVQHLYYARFRCNKAPSYKNRKCFLTHNQIKKLWFRDKAYLLKQPSLDRTKPNGNYHYKQCRFIEKNENCKGYKFGGWDKNKKCLDCGTTKNRYFCKGLCIRCYSKMRWSIGKR